ncbi:pre-rRNA 2'-O-ribose RNA methyltransferase-like [Conger conger]|uniref:pre-rRNA 2'-O-ribose RNA methyltransferase-like n=1 Tax=Conger conger TaxID=82655 RepID=UPI002A599CB3|nr:pre-rRNA 2'-O-ribose RNA methyltransferase-like [Conger conger]
MVLGTGCPSVWSRRRRKEKGMNCWWSWRERRRREIVKPASGSARISSPSWTWRLTQSPKSARPRGCRTGSPAEKAERGRPRRSLPLPNRNRNRRGNGGAIPGSGAGGRGTGECRSDEKKHRRKPVPVTKEMVEEYKQHWREINARPIKRVAEAKARKKRRMLKKMEQAKKKAEAVVNTVDISERERMAQLKSIYKKAGAAEEKWEVTCVVAKKGAGRRVRGPAGVKGVFHVVHGRMKKDMRGLQRKEHKGGKGGKGGRGRGKGMKGAKGHPKKK